MVRKMGNYIYVPRSIFEDESLDDARFSRREAFLYLVQRATYEQEKIVAVKGGRVTLKRGQMLFSLRKLADKWGWGKDKVSKTLADFESERRIDIFKDSLISIISIINYDLYQGGADSNTPIDADTTAPTSADTNKDADKDGIKNNKEGKENKEGKKNKSIYAESVERIYSLYPSYTVRPEGNSVSLKSAQKDKNKIRRLLESGKYTEESITYTINRYVSESKREYLKVFQSFLNQMPDYSEQPSVFEQPKEEEHEWPSGLKPQKV